MLLFCKRRLLFGLQEVARRVASRHRRSRRYIVVIVVVVIVVECVDTYLVAFESTTSSECTVLCRDSHHILFHHLSIGVLVVEANAKGNERRANAARCNKVIHDRSQFCLDR
jgi:hypothetical protein